MKSLILITLLACAFAAQDYCAFFKSFGTSFSGAKCSTNLNTGCTSVVDGIEQIKKLLAGDNSALFILISDLTNAYNSAKNSLTECEFEARFTAFISNFAQIYNIVIQNFGTLKADVECVITSASTFDLAKLGECAGDILHILTTKA